MNKVNIIAGDISGGGGEKWVRKFYEKNYQEFSTQLYLLGEKKELQFEEKYVYPSTKRFKKRIFKTLYALLKIVRDSRNQKWILASGLFNVITIPIVKLFGSPQLIIVRETNLPLFFNKYLKILYPLLNLANFVIAQSYEMKMQLIQVGVRAEKIRIIYNPIEKNRTVAITEPTLSNVKLAYIGRYCYQKGTDRIISAIDDGRLSSYSSLFFYGSGDIKIESNNKIKDLGWKSHINFEDFDILLFPSRWEGLPNIILETISSGKPIITSKWRGGYEELKHYSNLFFLKDGWNGNINDAIDQVINRFNKNEYIENSKKINLEFDENKIYSQWIQILND